MSEIQIPDRDGLLLDNLTLSTPAQVNRSAWTGRRKVVGLPGTETWRGSATIDSLSTEDAERPWRAFMFALRGPVNWFRWRLPCQRHIGILPVVGPGAGNGYSLPVVGMQANTRILRAGQYMTVPLLSGHHRTVVLTSDLRADGSGAATATFEPALNETPQQGNIIETVNPFIPMSLTETEQGFALSDGISGASFAVEEAL